MESNIKILRHGFADNISDYHYSNFQLSNSIPLGAILNFILKKLILHFDYVTLHNWLYHQNKNFFWKLSMYLNRKCLHKGDGLNSFRTVFISKIFLVNPHCPLKWSRWKKNLEVICYISTQLLTENSSTPCIFWKTGGTKRQ